MKDIKIDVDNIFLGGLIEQVSNLLYEPSIIPNYTNVFLAVEIEWKSKSVDGNFSFIGNITWLFKLLERTRVTENDFFECYVFTRDHLQTIIDSMYKHQKNRLDVELIPFDKQSADIRKILNRLRGDS